MQYKIRNKAIGTSVSLFALGLLIGCGQSPNKPDDKPEATASEVQAMVTVQPSFDCAKASKPQERLICTDNELAALDVKLADAYKVAIQSGDKAVILQGQRQWIKQSVNTCTDKSCLAAAYRNRIAELEGSASTIATANRSSAPTAGHSAADTTRNETIAKCLGLHLALQEVAEKFGFQEKEAIDLIIVRLSDNQNEGTRAKYKSTIFGEYNRVHDVIVKNNIDSGSGAGGRLYDEYQRQIKAGVACYRSSVN